MSQRNVEQVVGKLVTDEAFRRRFVEDPASTLREIVAGGLDLNPCEQQAIAAIDSRLLAWFASAIDPRIQKSDLRRSAS